MWYKVYLAVWAKLWWNQNRLHGVGANQFGFHWMNRIPPKQARRTKGLRTPWAEDHRWESLHDWVSDKCGFGKGEMSWDWWSGAVLCWAWAWWPY